MTQPRNAGAEAIDYAVHLYADNDPAKSKSGSPEGLARRAGRRDAAVGLVARIMMVDEATARQSLEAFCNASHE